MTIKNILLGITIGIVIIVIIRPLFFNDFIPHTFLLLNQESNNEVSSGAYDNGSLSLKSIEEGIEKEGEIEEYKIKIIGIVIVFCISLFLLRFALNLHKPQK